MFPPTLSSAHFEAPPPVHNEFSTFLRERPGPQKEVQSGHRAAPSTPNESIAGVVTQVHSVSTSIILGVTCEGGGGVFKANNMIVS